MVNNIDKFREITNELRVLARSSPDDKYLLATGLKQLENVVAMTGDGKNDAPERKNADIVSGSRYLKTYPGDSQPPAQRLFINRQITRQLNQRLGLNRTDAFCGFKAYRVEALKLLDIQDDGYAMPLEFWVQAAMRRLRVIEIPVPLIYLDLNRSFGGALDEAEKRLSYYNECIERSVAAMKAKGFDLPKRESACQGCP